MDRDISAITTARVAPGNALSAIAFINYRRPAAVMLTANIHGLHGIGFAASFYAKACLLGPRRMVTARCPRSRNLSEQARAIRDLRHIVDAKKLPAKFALRKSLDEVRTSESESDDLLPSQIDSSAKAACSGGTSNVTLASLTTHDSAAEHYSNCR